MLAAFRHIEPQFGLMKMITGKCYITKALYVHKDNYKANHRFTHTRPARSCLPRHIDMNLPSFGSWGTAHRELGFDYKEAFEKFGGVSAEQAQNYFAENALYYQELLYYMPQLPFEYYFETFQKYILSNDAKGDSDGASAFIDNVFDFIEADYLDLPKQRVSTMLESAKYVSTNQSFYEAPLEIYGDFESRFEIRFGKFKTIVHCV